MSEAESVTRFGLDAARIVHCVSLYPELVEALRLGRDYVLVHAANAPHNDGGAEAKADLAKIDAVLAKVKA